MIGQDFVPANYLRRVRDIHRICEKDTTVAKYFSELRNTVSTKPVTNDVEIWDRFITGLAKKRLC